MNDLISPSFFPRLRIVFSGLPSFPSRSTRVQPVRDSRSLSRSCLGLDIPGANYIITEVILHNTMVFSPLVVTVLFSNTSLYY
ncbi:hypothetical protein E2C01_020184 [Portunus trituberculatus]|uniref:Uncharacterized protein n=1 Tax=Portunus trituberculatus TaxID=210409 RepID=A0A5B7DZA0_PORTR|nr:hypothetical protein [Portunus trituberculatus]